MSSSVSDSNLEKKFHNVTNTQDNIQSLSLWVIHHKSHCKKIVEVWMKVLKKAKIGHRLTLFYLANDIIQNSKRKGAPQFLDAFSNVLTDAALFLRDDKIRPSVERVLTIWDDRGVYQSQTIEELKGLLSNSKTPSAAVTKLVAEYKYENTIEKIRAVCQVENETSSKCTAINNSKYDAANSEVLRQFKDRKHGQQFSKDFEDATQCMEEYISALVKEIAERAELIQILEQSEIYYSTQMGEAKIVANAYKNFSSRVTAQKKRIEELIAKLPSPFPSPCPDAPSPTNSEEAPDFSMDPDALVPSPKSDSIPSPEGTPEGLRLSPGDQEFVAQPITSFMPQAGMMPSWLEAFQSGSPVPPSEGTKGASSSLDSRLMTMMHKIPSPHPVQSVATALFLEQKHILALGGDDTPVKDEHSGQGTPVQDEESNGPLSAAGGPSKSSQNNAAASTINKTVVGPLSTQYTKLQGDSENTFNATGSMKPPWNKQPHHPSKSDTLTRVNVKKSVGKSVEPLEPPPKPNFGNFGMLESPPSTSFSGNNIVINPAASSSTSTPSKSPRQDPRLHSQSYKSNRHPQAVPGADDTELMDMEIEDSEDEGTPTNQNDEKKNPQESAKKNEINNVKKDAISSASVDAASLKNSVKDEAKRDGQDRGSYLSANNGANNLNRTPRGRGQQRGSPLPVTRPMLEVKGPGYAYAPIETIQTLRGDTWDSQRPDEFMPNYDPRQPPHLPPSGLYGRPSDFDPRYNGSGYLYQEHDYSMDGFEQGPPMPPRNFGGPPLDHKRFANPRPPFQRGRRGFYQKRY